VSAAGAGDNKEAFRRQLLKYTFPQALATRMQKGENGHILGKVYIIKRAEPAYMKESKPTGPA